MNKEELVKEAKKSCIDKTHYCIGGFGGNAYCEGYYDGAESREKQIQALGERCLQLQKDKGNLTDRINELEVTNKKISDECHKLVDSLAKSRMKM